MRKKQVYVLQIEIEKEETRKKSSSFSEFFCQINQKTFALIYEKPCLILFA